MEISVPRATGPGVLQWVSQRMAQSMKSYVELQRQHITSQLRQRETNARKAAEVASQAACDDVAADLALTKEALARG